MIFKYKFCLWLIDALSNKPLTLPEIQRKWLASSVNEDGDPLAERTFNRYRRMAESLMNVDIICDRRDGNLYKIVKPEGFKEDKLQQWILSTFRVSSLSDRVNQREGIVIDPAPPASSLLQTIMDSIDKSFPLQFIYKSHYVEAKEMVLYPAFVRLFRQRWYVVGEVKGEDRTATCALERMTNLECLSNEKIKISSKFKNILKPEVYFEDCYGVIRQFETILIRFRAFWPQDGYIKDLPIHSSQTIVGQTENYTDFEIFVRPTYDLKQEFLWHRDKLAVISPESFKNDMIGVLHATLNGYETGENFAIDE